MYLSIIKKQLLFWLKRQLASEPLVCVNYDYTLLHAASPHPTIQFEKCFLFLFIFYGDLNGSDSTETLILKRNIRSTEKRA